MLIIGILAVIAVPQYQKAVYKSRATEALTMLKTIVQAQEVYYLANGEHTADISELDIEVPSGLIEDSGEELPENSYVYTCTINYCAAHTGNANMPNFEFNFYREKHGVNDSGSKFFCHLGSSGKKNESVKSICQSMGGILFTGWDHYSWAVGNYFVIN